MTKLGRFGTRAHWGIGTPGRGQREMVHPEVLSQHHLPEDPDVFDS